MKTSLVSTTLATLLLAVGAVNLAQASPIVTSWSYDLGAIWTSYAPNSGVTLSGDSKTLTWPTGDSSQSSLVIDDSAANGTVHTYIGGGLPSPSFIANGPSLTHHNHVINGSSLNSATLKATLNLQAMTPPPPGSAFNLPPISFDIQFVETPNNTPCAVTPHDTVCPDIFVLVGGLLNQTFTYGSNAYFVNIFPTNNTVLGQIGEDACDAADAPADCIGFTTEENRSTTLPFGFTISTEELTTSVPEPGILALFGFGLAIVGIGFRRRRNAA